MEIKRPVTVYFNYHNENNEYAPDVTLTFQNTEDMTIGTLHRFCKKFAITLGYAPETVEKAFGEDIFDEI